MGFNKKVVCIVVLLLMFFAFLAWNFVFNRYAEQKVIKVISPVEFQLDNGQALKLNNVYTFDPDYTDLNTEFAKKFNISKDEAFILGNLGKYWAKNLLEGRKVVIGENDLIYYRFGYMARLKNSPFCIERDKPSNQRAFERQLKAVRRGKFVIFDLDSDRLYPISEANRQNVKNYVIVRKNHVKNVLPKVERLAIPDVLYKPVYKSGNFKIIVSDLTTKLIPDRKCSSEICKELLNRINNAQNTIDIAIYGYSSTPEIEKAIEKANARGVKIRLVYDIDQNGKNIYPDTFNFLKLISDNRSDKLSAEVRNTMHNKFYVFDGKAVITGSANLSHTDMSGYNSNSVIVIDSPKVAEFYEQEFSQMFNGKFHNEKFFVPNKMSENITVYFSPQDKAITNGVLPIIKNAKKYIYIPAFVITEKRITSELIKAKARGVDVRVIADSLNASTKHSKHRELRAGGVLVKAENYAGKMHSKTMIVDDEYLIIGSMNFSNSGENKNDENLVIIKDDGAAKFYKQFFIYQWNRIPDKWLKNTPRAEGKDSIGSCSDGLDNNYDGLTDMEDIGCRK